MKFHDISLRGTAWKLDQSLEREVQLTFNYEKHFF